MWGFILEVCAVYVQCASEHMHGVRDSVMRRGLCKVTSLTRFRRFVVKRTNEAQTQKPDATYAPLRNSTFKTPTLSEDNASLLQCGHWLSDCRFDTHVKEHYNRWSYLDMVHSSYSLICPIWTWTVLGGSTTDDPPEGADDHCYPCAAGAWTFFSWAAIVICRTLHGCSIHVLALGSVNVHLIVAPGDFLPNLRCADMHLMGKTSQQDEGDFQGKHLVCSQTK